MQDLCAILHRDEFNYIKLKLEECESNNHWYYVHSRLIPQPVWESLVEEGLFIHSNKDYTYVCKSQNKEKAIEQMPLNPPDTARLN